MIFDFVKNAGEKVMSFFSNEDANEVKAEKITTFIGGLNLPIENFGVNVESDKAILSGQTNTNEIKEKVIIAAGNVEGIAQIEDQIQVAQQAQQQVPMSQFYTVQSGDTLSKISKNFYNDPMKYNQIFEANKPLLIDPNKIYPGQTLRIPQEGNTEIA